MEAQVRMKESLTGVLGMADLAMNRAEEKIENVRAKALVSDDMIDSGLLTDYASNNDEIERELEKITVQNSVKEESATLKSEGT